MTFNVRLPNGVLLKDIPDGMTKAQIIEKLRASGYDVPSSWMPRANPAQIKAAMAAQAALPASQRSAAFAKLPPAIQQAIRQQIKSDAQAANTPEARAARFQQLQAQNVASMPWYQKLAAGAGQSVYQTARGIGQLLGVESQNDLAAARAQDAPLLASGWGRAGNIGGQLAQMALPVGNALKAVGVADKAAPIIGAAINSGAFMGAQPVHQGGSHVRNALVGMAEGAGGAMVSPALGKLAQRVAPALGDARTAAIALANRYGIPLHISQVTNSNALNTLASAAKYLPFAGNAGAARAQQAAWNRALSNQIGENAESLSDQLLTGAGKRISDAYDALWSRNSVHLTPDEAKRLVEITNNAARFGGHEAGQLVGSHVDSIIDHLGPGDAMPGRTYQALRTDQLLPAENGAHPAAGHYLKLVRKVLQQAADRSVGKADAAELRRLNGQYNSLKILEKAISKRAAGAGGDVAPGHLWSLVNGKYGSTQEMRDLARLGQTVLRDPIPDSATASRELAYGALGIGGYAFPHVVLPAAAAGATVGRALNSPLLARIAPDIPKNTLLGLSRLARTAPYALPVATVQAGGSQ